MTKPVRSARLVALDDEEWQVLRGLRELSEGPLRSRLISVVNDVVVFAASAGCLEAGTDGLPGAGTHVDCERCQRAMRVLDTLRTRVRGV